MSNLLVKRVRSRVALPGLLARIVRPLVHDHHGSRQVRGSTEEQDRRGERRKGEWRHQWGARPVQASRKTCTV
jgi:hypothetical protein